ncbi:MAG: chemotaxis protein CheW [Pseudomonadota bacterium]
MTSAIATSTSLESFELNQQYLTFVLDNETYGVDVLQVHEIRAWESARPIPESPDYINGVLDLRGEIVPIIDLRSRFNLESVDYTPTTVTIVVSVSADNHSDVVGIVVDAVSDVLTIDANDLRDPPNLGHEIKTEFMVGMVSSPDGMVMLLDTQRLFDRRDLNAITRS